MKVVESIKIAREKKINDQLILTEIRKQNSEKELFFKKAEERGATATDILNEIIKQNTSKEDSVTPLSPDTPSPTPPSKEGVVPILSIPKKETPPSVQKKPDSSSVGKTLLTKESQEREEEMRRQFLKRIEAKERGEDASGNSFFSTSSQDITSSQEEMMGDLSSIAKPKIPVILIIAIAVLLLAAFILLTIIFL